MIWHDLHIRIPNHVKIISFYLHTYFTLNIKIYSRKIKYSEVNKKVAEEILEDYIYKLGITDLYIVYIKIRNLGVIEDGFIWYIKI